MHFQRCEACRSDCTDSCYADKARSLQVPTVAQMRQRFAQRDRIWYGDNDAYKRLRRDGIQPATVTGSAEMEAKLSKDPPRNPDANDRKVVDLAAVRAGKL